MTSSTPAFVVSGLPYTVSEVDGRTPAALEDFVGVHRFVARRGVDVHEVPGSGTGSGSTVRFFEKAVDGGGKDVRVWSVTRSAEGEFLAEHAAMY